MAELHGVMFNTCVNFKFINGEEKCSFEYSEWNCKVANSAIKIIAVYRPPYSQGHAITSSTFFEEFSSFLEGIVMCPEILLIAGDLNFHLDDLADDDSMKFIEVLETFGLIQHVMVPTHVSNHILDIIVTRSSSDIIISEIQASLFLFDHPNLRKKEIQFRRMRREHVVGTDFVSSLRVKIV